MQIIQKAKNGAKNGEKGAESESSGKRSLDPGRSDPESGKDRGNQKNAFKESHVLLSICSRNQYEPSGKRPDEADCWPGEGRQADARYCSEGKENRQVTAGHPERYVCHGDQ